MDKNKLAKTMLIMSVMMLAYFWLTPKPNKPADATKVGLTQPPADIFVPATAPATAASAPAPEKPPEIQTVTLGGASPSDPEKMSITVTNDTAGIEEIKLNAREYTQTAKDKHPFVLLHADPAAPKPFSTQWMVVNGRPLDLRTNTWTFVPGATRDEVKMEITPRSSQTGPPIMRVTKIFHLDPTSYNVTISHEIQNLSDQPLTIAINQLGPIDLPFDSWQSDPRMFQATILNTDSSIKFVKANGKVLMQAAVGKTGKESLGNFSGNNHLLWAATSDRFFTIILRPTADKYTSVKTVEKVEDGTIATPDFAGEMTTEVLGERPAPGQPDPVKICGLRLDGNTLTLAPRQITTMPLALYMGPKKRDILDGSPDAPADTTPFTYFLYKYGSVIQIGQGMCAFCTFTWLANLILLILDFVHTYLTFGNYGLAIIVLVIVVRLLMHPLTRYSQVNMATMQKKMAEIKPEIDKLEKKYPKDRAKREMEKAQLFKERKINPAGGILGCLPMLLQTPIWAALYSGLAIDIDLRHASFIPGWINDLSNPDLAMIAHPGFHVPVIGLNRDGVYSLALNILPLLLALVFFVQMKVQQKIMPKPTDPQQAQTQKMSQYMILLFPIFLYNAPSGLNVYIFASTLGGIVDTWLVRRHMKRKEDRENNIIDV